MLTESIHCFWINHCREISPQWFVVLYVYPNNGFNQKNIRCCQFSVSLQVNTFKFTYKQLLVAVDSVACESQKAADTTDFPSSKKEKKHPRKPTFPDALTKLTRPCTASRRPTTLSASSHWPPVESPGGAGTCSNMSWAPSLLRLWMADTGK
jgi:hypothetical protein